MYFLNQYNNNQLKKWFILMIVYCTLVQKIKCQNEICNGNFENYTLNKMGATVLGYTQNYLLSPNNISCWYSKTNTTTTIQIKTFTFKNHTTQLLDLVTNGPYIPCQKLTLLQNSYYKLQFDLLLDIFQFQANISIIINNVIVGNVISNSFIDSTHYVANILMNVSINQICFNLTNIVYNGSFANAFSLAIDKAMFGPLIDNVSLIFISINNNNTIPANNSNNMTNNITNNTNNVINYTNITNINNITNNNNSNITNSNNNANTNINNIIINSNNNTNSTQNSSNTNTNQNNNKINIPQLIINLQTQWNPYKGTLIFISTFNPQLYGIDISIFQYTRIQLYGQLIKNIQYKTDDFGYLIIVTYPQIVYSTEALNNLKIYMDQFILYFYTACQIVFIINGNQIQANVLSDSQTKFIKQLQPFVDSISNGIRKTFTIMNLFYCSYFIMNLIQFWNLTLLYNFLFLASLPKFSQAILSRMINFYFTYNSLSMEINKMLKKNDPTQNLFDFSNLTTLQKMSNTKNGQVWFGFLGASSNFMVNNFDSLMLMSFFFVKILLLMLIKKTILTIFPTLTIMKKLEINFRNFPNELLCFSPFFLISSTQVFLYIGQMTFLGKINNILHISFTLIIIYLSCYKLYNLSQPKKPIQPQNDNKTQILNSKTKKVQNGPTFKYQQINQIFLGILIPVLIIIRSLLAFFVIVSFIILIKLFLVFHCKKHYENCVQKITNSFSKINWFAFHISFLTFFIVDNLRKKGLPISDEIIKYFGFVVIGGILLGALIDICQFLIKIGILLFKGIKYIHEKCKQENNSLLNNKMNFKAKQQCHQSNEIFSNNEGNSLSIEIPVQKIKSKTFNLSNKNQKDISQMQQNDYKSYRLNTIYSRTKNVIISEIE